jgi:hypothetical protein
MLKHTRTAIISILVASSLSIGGRRPATADSKLPEPATAGFAEKLRKTANPALACRMAPARA